MAWPCLGQEVIACQIRNRVRRAFRINGGETNCTSCCIGCWCPCLSLAQTAREMDHRGLCPGGCFKSPQHPNVPRPVPPRPGIMDPNAMLAMAMLGGSPQLAMQQQQMLAAHQAHGGGAVMMQPMAPGFGFPTAAPMYGVPPGQPGQFGAAPGQPVTSCQPAPFGAAAPPPAGAMGYQPPPPGMGGY
jgi:hypothetical protein